MRSRKLVSYLWDMTFSLRWNCEFWSLCWDGLWFFMSLPTFVRKNIASICDVAFQKTVLHKNSICFIVDFHHSVGLIYGLFRNCRLLKTHVLRTWIPSVYVRVPMKVERCFSEQTFRVGDRNSFWWRESRRYLVMAGTVWIYRRRFKLK
jgi:hypothetical protein